MKKIKIGIPKTYLYYQNNVFWKIFFEKLNCKVIISPDTNNEIIKLGFNNTINDSCLPYKIYLGHAIYLSNICDYILIPKIYNYGNKLYTCPLFNIIYDNLKQVLPINNILTYHIDYINYHYEFFEYLKLALKLTKNPIKIIYSYLFAKYKQNKYNLSKLNEQKNKLGKQGIKILIVSKFYNIDNTYLMNNLNTYLKNNNIIPLYSNYLDKKTAIHFSKYYSNNLYLKDDSELLGTFYYYKYQVDGIIFITNKFCNSNLLITNLVINNNKDIPIFKLSDIELLSNIELKISQFINIVKEKYNNK